MEFIKSIDSITYLLVLLVVAMALEIVIPWRRSVKIDFTRWARNASMAVYGTLLVSLLPAIAAYGASVTAQEIGIGLLNWINIPQWLALIVAVLALDLTSYGQHRILHKSYFFWRTHRTHHCDTHIDATTSLRFHPLETLFRVATEFIVIMAIGITPEGILLSYLVKAFANIFTHANIFLPPAILPIVSRVITTPHIHRLHHATTNNYQYSNFGTIFTVWDQLFNTYVGPENLHDDQRFGIDGVENIEEETFGNLVLDPFRTPKNAAIPKPDISEH